MVIMHNTMASYASRYLNINTKNKSLKSERLGSGYKINRAADNAASLAISEKMRGQIRGLLKASRNVLEGSDLIDTADGAMSEQVNILQRIRELTIQAYNDTYTQEDRLQIQFEVNAHLEELDRIAKETEFNTQKILQGNKKTVSVTTEVIEPTEQYRYVTKIVTTKKKIPDWLRNSCDMNLTLNNSRVGSNVKQDTQDYAIINQNKVDPTQPEIFYGPENKKPPNFQGDYGGEWTPDMKNNYSAVVSFSEIANCTNKNDLLEKLIDLSGVALAYECATCYDRAQGFYFDSDDIKVSSINTLEDLDGENAGKEYLYPTLATDMKRINLQPFIDKVGVIDDSVFSADTAREIAKGIVDEIVGTNSSNHFIRITGDADNPYNVVFYDFRDEGATSTKLAGNAIGNAFVKLSVQTQVESKPFTMEHINEKYNGLYIQAGANTNQGIIIDLPDTTLAGLLLEGYTIFREGYCSAGKNGMYDPDLLEHSEYLGNNQWHSNNVGGHKVTSKETISGTRVIMETKTTLVHPGGTNADGEYVRPKYSTEVISQRTEPYSYEITKTTMVGGHPMTFTAYKPDTLLRVDRAIAILTKNRTDLGAMKNRLEHAYLNDTNEAENLQSAESKMRDADYANEMVAYSISNILEQVSQSILAQANRSRDGILALLNM